jgi:hypothetical protein
MTKSRLFISHDFLVTETDPEVTPCPPLLVSPHAGSSPICRQHPPLVLNFEPPLDSHLSPAHNVCKTARSFLVPCHCSLLTPRPLRRDPAPEYRTVLLLPHLANALRV